MKKAIPQFSAKDINKIDDYEQFRNTKAYLLQKSGPLTRAKDQKDEIWKLAESVGYKKYNKFLTHRQEWHELNRKIPISYLDVIGIDYDVLDFVVDLDKEEYERALEVPLYPRGFTIRLMACAYKTVELPPNTPECEAIEIMQEYARREGKSCAINYPSLKTILVGTEGQIKKVYYEPNIHFENGFLICSTDGSSFAKVTSS